MTYKASDAISVLARHASVHADQHCVLAAKLSTVNRIHREAIGDLLLACAKTALVQKCNEGVTLSFKDPVLAFHLRNAHNIIHRNTAHIKDYMASNPAAAFILHSDVLFQNMFGDILGTLDGKFSNAVMDDGTTWTSPSVQHATRNSYDSILYKGSAVLINVFLSMLPSDVLTKDNVLTSLKEATSLNALATAYEKNDDQSREFDSLKTGEINMLMLSLQIACTYILDRDMTASQDGMTAKRAMDIITLRNDIHANILIMPQPDENTVAVANARLHEQLQALAKTFAKELGIREIDKANAFPAYFLLGFLSSLEESNPERTIYGILTAIHRATSFHYGDSVKETAVVNLLLYADNAPGDAAAFAALYAGRRSNPSTHFIGRFREKAASFTQIDDCGIHDRATLYHIPTILRYLANNTIYHLVLAYLNHKHAEQCKRVFASFISCCYRLDEHRKAAFCRVMYMAQHQEGNAYEAF